MSDLYEAAVREWVARRIRGRGHKVTRDKIRNVRFGIDTGFHGSDVTPPDEPLAGFTYELQQFDPKRCSEMPHWVDAEGWHKLEEGLENTVTPANLVQQVLAIYEELRGKT